MERRKKVRQLNDPERKLVDEIQARIDNQDKLKTAIIKGNNDLGAEIDKMKSSMAKSLIDLAKHNERTMHTKIRITQISQEVAKIKEHREKLAFAISEHNKGSQKAS
jgi:hypothetical protein